MSELLALFGNGIADGSIYALGALGATVLFGVLNIGNFAYGDYMTFGAFCALGAADLGIPFVGAVIVGVAATAVLSVTLDITLFRPLQRKGAGPGGVLMLSVGLALVVRYAIYIIAGANEYAYSVHDSTALTLGPVRVSSPELIRPPE